MPQAKKPALEAEVIEAAGLADEVEAADEAPEEPVAEAPAAAEQPEAVSAAEQLAAWLADGVPASRIQTVTNSKGVLIRVERV